MLRQKTLLVLGAGSSADFGFPIGNGLADQIGDALSRERFSTWHGQSSDETTDASRLPLPGVLLNRFLSAQDDMLRVADKMCRDLRLAGSIDTYLGNNADDTLAVEIGKVVIVDRILAAERASGLFLMEDARPYDPYGSRPRKRLAFRSTGVGSWLDDLLRMLVVGLQPAARSELFSNLQVMSFNYDRVLEQYLKHRVQEYLGLDEEGAAEMMERLTITRPYGRIGPLSWQANRNEEAVDFGGRCDLLRAAKSIRTFTEQIERTELKPFREQVAWAQQVVFLGFGFHRQNMEYLKAPEESETARRRVYATVKGISQQNQDVVRQEVCIAGSKSQLVELYDGDSAGLLDAFKMSLS